MNAMEIEGGIPLCGTVRVSGNKNAALPAIAAALLTEETVILENMPNILDVRHLLELIESIGCKAEWDKTTLSIDSSGLNTHAISQHFCSLVRTSILFAAPLLHRMGKAEIFPPGGDVIGRRRLDTHFYGLEKLGAQIEWGNSYRFDLKGQGFKGADLFFDEASVTATEHIIMAAAVAEGESIIRNCASEPHVQDIARLVQSMGATVEGIGTNQLKITGNPNMKGCRFAIGPDHIEAASFLSIAAATGGEITVEGINQRSSFWMAHRVFERLGIDITLNSDNIYLSPHQTRKIKTDLGGSVPTIDDGPWPQFPSDMMSCMIVLATQVEGTCLFFEKMFESRLFFVDRLIAMGANAVLCDPHRVVITGPRSLRPMTLHSPDIRAGMALLGAGLCAHGTSRIENIAMIDRGYQDIEKKLQQLGARVRRIDR